MKITFHGAAHTVTGSQHLLEINGHSLLLECGLYQGRRAESYKRNRNFHFEPEGLDAVILSHAHIDHSGNLPNLVKSGYSGPIYGTAATCHLGNLMLMDSGHIQESDVEYLNKKRRRDGQPPVEPLYTMADAARVAQQFQAVPYDQVFEPVPGVRARLVEAGHILGSAAVVLDIEERKFATHKNLRLWFSGDIGRLDLPLLRDPVLPQGADYLLMECTYGDKPHRDPQMAYDELREVVGRTLGRGGKVIIPAFAVGRTQELVYDLNRMMDGGEIPRAPVFVDSPLAVNASDIFRAHPECFDQETREFMAQNQRHAALDFEMLTYTRSVAESKALNDRKDPMVIISASGMAETGRILHHLKNNIENPLNTVLIVSWQAPHTLGRRLAERQERIKIFGETYERRADVATIGGLSAHAGQTFLLDYVQATQEGLKEIFLVHGEADAASALIEKLAEQGVERVAYPPLHSSIEV
jgi:metallo-beta-lactamase family protein